MSKALGFIRHATKEEIDIYLGWVNQFPFDSLEIRNDGCSLRYENGRFIHGVNESSLNYITEKQTRHEDNK